MHPVLLAVLPLIAPQTSDTVVVQADQLPAWGADAAVVEELRIGALEGPPEYTFGMVRGVAVAPDGGVYVADMQVPALREYGGDGRYLRDVGREGQGPGEYVYLYGLRALPGGGLALLDPRNARVTFYQDGQYDRSFPSRSGLHSADIFAVDTAGRSYVKTILPAQLRRQTTSEGVQVLMGEPPKGWIVLDGTGTVLDTLEIPAEDEVGGGFVLSGKGGYFRPFSVMTVSTLSPHGYQVWARNDAYAVYRPLPDGRILKIQRTADPVRVKPDERAQWEAWVDYFAGTARERGMDSEYGPIPDEKPFIRHLFVDDDGRIWVARYAEAHYRPYSQEERAERGDRPSFEWRQPLVWDVFTPAGRFLGQVTLPFGTSLLAARGTTVWGSQSGDFDEEYVVRFRITGSGVER